MLSRRILVSNPRFTLIQCSRSTSAYCNILIFKSGFINIENCGFTPVHLSYEVGVVLSSWCNGKLDNLCESYEEEGMPIIFDGLFSDLPTSAFNGL